MKDKEDKIRERLWKNIGLAGDIHEKIESEGADESKIESVLEDYELTSEADDLKDVFKNELYRTIKCIKYFNENSDLKREQALELNKSFDMLKTVARKLDIQVK